MTLYCCYLFCLWQMQMHPVLWPSVMNVHGGPYESASEMERAAAGPLGSEQLRNFADNGFIIARSLFDEREVEMMWEETERVRDFYETRMAESDSLSVTATSKAASEPIDGERILRSVFEVHKGGAATAESDGPPATPLCHRVSRDGRLATAANQILNDPHGVYVHQSRLNYQPAFHGTGFQWHSDFETWHAEDGMPVTRALSCVIMLSENTAGNGALMLVPGSHHQYVRCAGETPARNWENSLRKQVHGTPSRELLRQQQEAGGLVHATGKAGDVIFFDCNTMHGSHNNISAWPRRNLFFVFNAYSNRVQEPYAAPSPRPEHIATRDPEWMQPLHPVHSRLYE